MQNKGAIKFFAIAFALVSLFQLSFTFFAKNVESQAEEYAHKEEARELAKQYAEKNPLQESYYYDSIVKARERFYLDSMKKEPVYNLLIREYTYQECKEREINLGLDLKGGMNVMLEVSVDDIITTLSNNSQDSTFRRAMQMARQKEKQSQQDFITLFRQSFEEIAPNAKLAAIFSTVELKDKITYNSTNDEVIQVLRNEVNGAFDRAVRIIRTRINRYGVSQPNIQPIPSSGRIMVELPGVKEPDRVRELLQNTAKLAFWETYKFSEIHQQFQEANKELAKKLPDAQIEELVEDSEASRQNNQGGKSQQQETSSEEGQQAKEADTAQEDEDLLKELEEGEDTTTEGQDQQFEQYAKENPLYAYLQPAFRQSEDGQYYPAQRATVGYAKIQDTAKVNSMLDRVESVFPRNLKLAWRVKPRQEDSNILELIALKVTTRDGSAPMTGEVITDARQDYSNTGQVQVAMSMDSEGTRTWKRLTGNNVGRQIAIVLDGYVYSAPNVNDEIPNGRSTISGNFTVKKAKDLANILEAGKLPAPVDIVQEEVVGPSLGQEAINSGFNSFLIAFILVLVLMVMYYNRAGWVSNLALVTNIFFIMGVLASLGAVLTLPGIAGIVLTIGMAVDANVIIYERIREEIRAGKGIRLALNDGYKNAYSAIIDGNITTLLTGVVLYIFGSGPVQGFATTLIIGILSSLFTAILISRVIFIWAMDKNFKVAFGNKATLHAFTNINVDFISKRRIFYVISGIIILIGIFSLLTKGLNQGVDFSGGRTYVVRFDNEVSPVKLRASLEESFGHAPEVKTFGPERQVKVTTKHLIDSDADNADSIVEAKLYQGLKPFFKSDISYSEFHTDEEKVIGKLSSSKVGPSIADDLLHRAYLALGIALVIIFIYIASRFRKWQYGLGGLVTLAHDSIIAISMYSIFYGILPFSLEIDQSTIAAILTIIGYSINDSVIIFDRIREYNTLYPKRHLKNNMNSAINSTLGRTFMTSGTTLLVLLAIFFFGGEIIRGFAFALIVGVIAGTYSSIFISTPVAYELSQKEAKKVAPKSKTKNKAKRAATK
ncbi:MAG: protein translocase subunit SecDF [Bacteroidales bacterium]|nr:protein translocase subunit SecDF [Bacteroidales bacterium]MCF8334299.1 protein translocase subunit SecDF [Bacteroidales bacterium]